MTWQTETVTAEDTEAVAERLGRSLKGGEVIELVSDLGGGKTTFVRGLVRGLGSTDKVASPTFTVSKVYATDTTEVYHFDFYRLHDPGLIAHELSEVIQDPQAIVVVEWADAVQHVLPDDRLTITIKQTPSGTRHLTFTYPESMRYAVQEAEA